jgi:sugar fermentation stimulation protein A
VLLPSPLREGRVLRRLNRFAVEVEVEGRLATAHLANSGRVQELLAPGTPALLKPAAGPDRKTPFDLLLVRLGSGWVSADARLPNALVREALARGRLAAFRRYAGLQAEVRRGASRIDFLLGTPPDACLLETKSVTLVEDGVALFPDAPTPRGRRHVEELTAALSDGLAAAVIFVVQRRDAEAFAPHERADAAFAAALRLAAAAGVGVYAYRCRVSPRTVSLAEPIEVRL